MVTLSPSVIVISLVTRNGSSSTRSVGPDHLFIGGGQHGIGEVRRAAVRASGTLTSPFTNDLAAGDAEIQVRRCVDARFRDIDHTQVLAVHANFAVGQAFAPLDLARTRERAGACLGGGTELELVGDDARFHLDRTQRQVELVEIDLRAG